MPAPDARLSQQELRDRVVRRAALARALMEARLKAGLTQQELADRSGVSRSAIVRLEAGAVSVSSDRVWSIAKALNVRPSALWAAAEADEAAAATLND